jgi:5-methylcytosine-specific restriction enzyme subunit McrC
VGPWVGVLQVPGLQLELLPKIEFSSKPPPTAQPEEELGAKRGRLNLLYMLELAGLTSFRGRGKAHLRVRRGTVNDQLLAQFLARLLEELRRGCDRTYFDEEDNLLTKRGRLLLSKHIARNSAQKHRFYCRFDTFGEQTQINSVLRAACERLARWSLPLALQNDVVEALAILDEVTPIADVASVPPLTFTRQNERFQDIYEFALLILYDQTPDPRAGNNQTFSLLFDMDKVFEGFVAQFIKRYVEPRIPGLVLHAQAKKHREYLFNPVDKNTNSGALELKPDLLFHFNRPGAPKSEVLVGDTKWKILDPKSGGRPSGDDFYQLYAYVRRLGCQSAFLLYPQTLGVSSRDFEALDAERAQVGRVGTRFVDLSVALDTDVGRQLLAEQLKSILLKALNLPASTKAGQ